MPLQPLTFWIQTSAPTFAGTAMPVSQVTAFKAISYREAGDLPEVRRIQFGHGSPTNKPEPSVNLLGPAQLSRPALPGSPACLSAVDCELSQPGLRIPPVQSFKNEPFPVFQKGPSCQNLRPDDAPAPPRAVRDCSLIHEKESKLQQTVPRGEKSMGSTQALTSYANHETLPEVSLPVSSNPLPIQPAESATWPKLWPQGAPLPQQLRHNEAIAQKCSEKSCVFPASPDGSGRCRQHDRQSREPNLFSSFQPTRLVLDRAKFGLPEAEVDTSRVQDRRKLADMRQAFLED